MDPSTAAATLTALFPDQGRGLLSEVGLPDWAAAVQLLPEAALQIDEEGEAAGERLLSRVRDELARRRHLDGAMALTRALHRRRVARHGEAHPDALVELGALGTLLDRAGRHAEARELLERAWEGLRATAGGRDLRVAVVSGNLGAHYLRVGEVPKAEHALEMAWRIRRELAPHTTGIPAAQLAEALLHRDKHEQAAEVLQDAWARHQDDWGADDPRTLDRARLLAAVLSRLGRVKEAVPVLRSAHQAARRAEPEVRHDLAFELGKALEVAGRLEEAYRLVVEVLGHTRAAGDSPELADRLSWYSGMVLRRGRPREAEGLLREALEVERRLHGDQSPQVASRFVALGNLCVGLGRRDEGLGFIEAGASLLRSTVGDADERTRKAVDRLLELLTAEVDQAIARKDHTFAMRLLERGRSVGTAVLGARHARVQKLDSYPF